MAENILFAWSSGKDSALALYELLSDERFKVSALLTTVTEGYGRVSMHGVPIPLLEQQALSLGIPLEKVFIPKKCSNREYEAVMEAKMLEFKAKGVESVAFGDIFLEDVKEYREKNLDKAGMKAVFPLWKRDTGELARQFIALGFKAIVSCVDSKFLGKDFAGRLFDQSFLSDLPKEVDPCGENGEFHSFAFSGPLFKKEISFEKGEVVLRDKRFFFCDLRPLSLSSAK